MIYAIQAVGLDLVKIGKAKDPEKRLKMLQTGSAVPLHLVASVAWSDLHEGMIHRRFAAHRRLGEWFEINDEISEFVQVMNCPNATEQKKFEVAMQILSEKETANVETPHDQPLIPVAEKSAGVDGLERQPTHQRWAKDKYNAYQREYMREYRKTAKTASRHGKHKDKEKRTAYLRFYMQFVRALKSGRAVAIPR